MPDKYREIPRYDAPRGSWVGFLLSAISLMPIEIHLCLFPCQRAPTLVLWVLVERNGFFQLVLLCWGSQALTHCFPFPCGRGHCGLCIPPLGESGAGKVSLTASTVAKLLFFFLSFFSDGGLESPSRKAGLLQILMPGSALTRSFPDSSERGVGDFADCVGSAALYGGCLSFTIGTCERGSSQVPWSKVLVPKTLIQALLFVCGCPIH